MKMELFLFDYFSSGSRSILFRIIVLVVLIYGSNGDNQTCINVGSYCYFQPGASSSQTIPNVDWFTAWQTCKNNYATLPVIRSQTEQTQLSTFLTNKFYNYRVWTAASLIESDAWRFVDGQVLANQGQVIVSDVTYDNSVFLTNNLNYTAGTPNSPRCYICQYNTSAQCSSFASAVQRGGNKCFVVNTLDSLSWYAARNQCLEGGGDLASLSELDDINSLSSLASTFTNDGCWIGIRKGRWIWNTTAGTSELNYNDWRLNQGNNIYQNCMYLFGNNFDWFQADCNPLSLSDAAIVLCQTAAAQSPQTSTLSTTTFSVSATTVSTSSYSTLDNLTPVSSPTKERGDQSQSMTTTIVVATVIPIIAIIICVVVIVIIIVVVQKKKQSNGLVTEQSKRDREALTWYEVLRLDRSGQSQSGSKLQSPPVTYRDSNIQRNDVADNAANHRDVILEIREDDGEINDGYQVPVTKGGLDDKQTDHYDQLEESESVYDEIQDYLDIVP